MSYQNFKKNTFRIISIGTKEDLPSRAFDLGLVTVIILNILSMFLETFEELSEFRGTFTLIENITVVLFCIEYALRIWTADLLYPKLSKGKAVLRFLRSFDGVVDLLTILPFFYLSGFVVFRMLRVVRIFHLFRINAQYDSFHVIVSVLGEKKKQILSSIFIIVVLMLASSLGMYNAEHRAQPEAFRNAFSGIWWSVSTLLTVGYGDIYPVTTIGKIMAIAIAFLGVGVVAIPTGIISAGFVENYTKSSHANKRFSDIEELGEIEVTPESGLAGKTIGEIEASYDATVMVLLRGDLTVIPQRHIKVHKRDLLVVRGSVIEKVSAPEKGKKRK